MTMFRTALKGAMAHKARLVLTSVAILLGVAFVTGTFVFTDTIKARFDTLFTDVYAGVDASVRGEAPEFGSDVTTELPAIPDSLVDRIRSLDDVSAAQGYIQTFGQIIDAKGDPVGGNGPPTYVYTWVDKPKLNPFHINEGNGRAPKASGEVVVDIATTEAANLKIGDPVDIQFGSGVRTFTLVGLASFGDTDNLAGATISVITLGDAQRIVDMPGQVNFIDVIGADGVDQNSLVTTIDTVLPMGVEAVTGEQQTAEAISGFTDGLGFLSAALLAFAAVAVFVGAFIIHNTFRIIVAQRTRELALFRAVGASSRQIVAVVLTEALTVGTLASAAGVVAGVGVAQLIKAAMDAVGFGPPDGPLTVLPRTVVVAMAVGLTVTLVSALLPALRAGRVPPVAAMQATTVRQDEKQMRIRLRIAVLAIGVVAITAGLVSRHTVITGIGAVLAVAAVLLLAPTFTRPVAGTVGRAMPGIAGKLARDNTARDPRRTSATASALTVGIALVVFTAIFASSAKDSISMSLDQAFPADLAVQSTNLYMAVSSDAVDRIAGTDGVEIVSPVRMGAARIGGTEATITAVDPSTIDRVYNADATIDPADLGDGLLVESRLMEERGLVVGDSVQVEFPSGRSADLHIEGTHGDSTLGSYVISEATWDRLEGGTNAAMVLVKLDGGVTLDGGKTAVEKALTGFPSLSVNTTSDQIASAEAQVDSFLVLFTALLGLALLIAVLGIANTLALSIVERTREIGLLRAVGMSRRQVRWMIRDESIVTSLFGALVGSALGLALGWIIVTTFSDQGLSAFSVPVGQVGMWLALSSLAGVAAAALPARKASRLDVLHAIAYE
jgi:putative ABC transport system permease protein